MSNLLILKAALAALVSFASIFASIFTAAEAQVASNSNLLAPPAGAAKPSIEKVSESDITSLLAPLGITTAPFEDGEQEAYTILATTQSGGQFLVTLFDCENPLTGAACSGSLSYAGFSNAGFAYTDLNRFNAEAAVSKAINLEEENIVLFGVQQFLAGGVTADNMQHVIVLFLNDLNNFMNADETNATAVSHVPTGESRMGAKTDNGLTAGAGDVQKSTIGAYSLDGAIASAINNTVAVSFDVTGR